MVPSIRDISQQITEQNNCGTTVQAIQEFQKAFQIMKMQQKSSPNEYVSNARISLTSKNVK